MKQRQIDRMEKIERPVLERRRIGLRLHPHERGGELRHAGVSFGDQVVLAGVDLTVVHGERVGFVGANGAGKSVLLKTVVGELEPTEGEVWVGPSIRIGLTLQRPNLLVLDEPTNHLDIDSVEALEAALEEFDGTVCVISHDRYFLDRVIVDRIVDVGGGEARSYEGSWSDWYARVSTAVETAADLAK